MIRVSSPLILWASLARGVVSLQGFSHQFQPRITYISHHGSHHGWRRGGGVQLFMLILILILRTHNSFCNTSECVTPYEVLFDE